MLYPPFWVGGKGPAFPGIRCRPSFGSGGEKTDYLEFTEFYENVERKLDTIQEMKKVGMHPVIKPHF